MQIPTVKIVKSKEQGAEIAKELILENISPETVLFLSGGSTPKLLYEALKNVDLKLGAAAIVDERFGKKMHENSNEKMIEETGLIDFFKKQSIRFYKVLEDKEIEETTKDYDETVRFLLYQFKKSIGILGIGEDGHIAGIPPGINLNNQTQNDLVISFDNFPGKHRERITLTFLALSMLDLIIVLVFGKEKKKALKKMLKEGSIEEIPARFLVQDEIAKKTIVITDQKI
ncbi:6-phosphogluconolactonase [Patescibacteria group bacterium]|nr:6-phosphogluconolactonase [Patescibacteria group bacterium]